MDNQKTIQFNDKEQVNIKLTPEKLTLKDLQTYLKIKFVNYKDAAHVVGISENRVRQIVIGYRVPKSAHLIRRIAAGWQLDEIKLTQLFDSLEDKK